MKISICYVPFPTKEDALSVIKLLISEKLIACGNIVSSESIFIWKGEDTSEFEWIAIMKTSISKINDVEDRIKTLHPYNVPAILNWAVGANEDYVNWIESTLNS